MKTTSHKPVLYIIGDSHTLALQRAATKVPELSEKFQISVLRLTEVQNGQRTGDIHIDDAVSLIEETGPDDVFVSVMGGNLYLMPSLAQHSVPYTIFDPDTKAPTPGMTLIPRHCFKAALTELMQVKELPKLKRLATASSGKTFHVCAPPPRAVADIDMQALTKEFVVLKHLDINSDVERLRAWHIQNEIQREACERLGVEFLTPPNVTLTRDKFLRPKLFAPDTTHANVGYGIYVLNQISERLHLDLTRTMHPSPREKNSP